MGNTRENRGRGVQLNAPADLYARSCPRIRGVALLEDKPAYAQEQALACEGAGWDGRAYWDSVTSTGGPFAGDPHQAKGLPVRDM
jgi:hypothetical protein